MVYYIINSTKRRIQIFNGYEIANGSAINGLFQYERRKAPKKISNGYKIVKGTAVNNIL